MTDSSNINREEILHDHSTLIHRVVMDCSKPGSVADLEQVLQLAEDNDWGKLVKTIRNIMSGSRDRSLLRELDEEESIIIESMLNGIENPASLPSVTADFQSPMAASGIASLIHASIQGNAESLNTLTSLTQQMLGAGGDFANIAERIRLMIEGERDTDKLTAGITEQRQKLVTEILAELTTVEAT